MKKVSNSFWLNPILCLFACLPTQMAWAQAGVKGGDPCEMRIQEIIEGGPEGGGLESWINDADPETGKLGPDDFRDEELFRAGVELHGETRAERISDYITRMNSQIKERKFFTNEQLEGIAAPSTERLLVVGCTKSKKPVEVNVNLGDLAQPEFRSFERVCWNSGGDERIAQITCDREAFERLNLDPKVNADLQYSLIHHEIAGLAGIEGNFRYGLSRVISEFMETREVRMLGHKRHTVDYSAGYADLTDIVQDEYGNVLHLNQYDADKYCRDHDSRLPTARELALWAVKFGAKISDYPQGNYYRVNGTDRDGKLDVFFFKYLSSYYSAPSANLGHYFYWSSSVLSDPVIYPKASDYAYTLVGEDGSLAWDARRATVHNGVYAFSAIRCVKSLTGASANAVSQSTHTVKEQAAAADITGRGPTAASPGIARADSLYHLPNLPVGSTITLIKDLTFGPTESGGAYARVNNDCFFVLTGHSGQSRILPAGTVITTTELGNEWADGGVAPDSTFFLDISCKTTASTDLTFECQRMYSYNPESSYFNEPLSNEYISIQLAPSVIIH